MSDPLVTLFEIVLYTLIGLVVARSLMTWFPVSHDNDFVRFLQRATEPLLAPFRRILPSLGAFDLSGLFVVILLSMMLAAVRRAGDL